MAFYKIRKKKVNGLFYPEAVVMGKQVSTMEVAAMLSDRSTVTRADTLAVLSDLGSVLSNYMAQGRSVKLDGIGSFRYTICAKKQGVESEEKVSTNQIKNVRVRFTPETTRNSDNSVATRSMQTFSIDWVKWNPKEEEKKPTTDEGEDNGDSGSGGTSGGGTGNNPL